MDVAVRLCRTAKIEPIFIDTCKQGLIRSDEVQAATTISARPVAKSVLFAASCCLCVAQRPVTVCRLPHRTGDRDGARGASAGTRGGDGHATGTRKTPPP